MIKRLRFFFLLYVLYSIFFYLLADEGSVTKSHAKHSLSDFVNRVAIDQNNNNVYLRGDINILSNNAPSIVKELSDKIYKSTQIQTILYVVKETPRYKIDTTEALTIEQKFQNRRLYETEILNGLSGHYAVIFLFYDDHAITLRSNLGFLNEKISADLLERYAYPYLPADSVGTLRYSDGVNEGVSNLYLALIQTISSHYGLETGAPKPMEQPNEATKVVLYAMLLILIGLFVLVRFGFLALKKRG